VNAIEKDLILSKEVIRCEQEADEFCIKYRVYVNFWTDEDGILYRQGPDEQPRVVIRAKLVHTVFVIYHELPFTAHQGLGRTIGFISRKYWWQTLRSDISTFIKNVMLL